jgi:hypothetical protein
MRITRRGLLGSAGGLALVGAGCDYYASRIEPYRLDLAERTVPVAHLPAAWQGLRVALLADLHYAWKPTPDWFVRAFAAAAAARPDLILHVGDYFAGPHTIGPDFTSLLAGLPAPLGSYGVPGNHDYDHGIPLVLAALDQAGVTMVTNSHVLLRRGDDTLCIAGVDDLWHGRPDLDAALAGVPQGTCRILLCHNPDFAEDMPPAPRVDLMLSGHTHGGQVRLPIVGNVFSSVRYRKYTLGLVQGPHCPVYISRGLGLGGPHGLRFNCRPELPILTLTRA